MKRAGKKMSDVIRIILLTAAAMILGISVYNWNAESLTGNQMPMPFGYGASIILSGSMEPELSVDDLVIIKETDEIELHDIVVFQEGSSLVIHRVVGIDNDQITTKGDANNTADQAISRSQIKGVLIYHVPYIGAAVSVLKQPISVFLILGAIVLLTELSYRKKKDKDQDELEMLRAEIEKLKEND